MSNIDSTLQERADHYGSFEHHAKIAQDLQRVLHAEAGWARLADDQRQALTVIMDKVARMLNGDPAYRDNWHDIVGYAKLVDDRMKRDNLEVYRANEAKAPQVPAATQEPRHDKLCIAKNCFEQRADGNFCPAHRAHRLP
jgi:hypothetical protein